MGTSYKVPRYINIMSCLITDKDEQAWSNDKDHFDDYSDDDRFSLRVTRCWPVIVGSCFIMKRQPSFKSSGQLSQCVFPQL
jgi:hypothetical protein